jgi:hypothetical protein
MFTVMVGPHRERPAYSAVGVQRHPEISETGVHVPEFCSSRDSGTARASARGSRADMHDHLSDFSHLCLGSDPSDWLSGRGGPDASARWRTCIHASHYRRAGLGRPFLLESQVRALIPFRRAAFPLPEQPPKMEAAL